MNFFQLSNLKTFFKSRKASYFIQTLVFNSERCNYNQVSNLYFLRFWKRNFTIISPPMAPPLLSMNHSWSSKMRHLYISLQIYFPHRQEGHLFPIIRSLQFNVIIRYCKLRSQKANELKDSRMPINITRTSKIYQLISFNIF